MLKLPQMPYCSLPWLHQESSPWSQLPLVTVNGALPRVLVPCCTYSAPMCTVSVWYRLNKCGTTHPEDKVYDSLRHMSQLGVNV
jgi:hypothetical protein